MGLLEWVAGGVIGAPTPRKRPPGPMHRGMWGPRRRRGMEIIKLRMAGRSRWDQVTSVEIINSSNLGFP